MVFMPIVTAQAPLPTSAPVQSTSDPANQDISKGLPAPEQETAPKQDEFAQKFAALAKREKAIRAKELAAKAREEELTRSYEAKLSESEKAYQARLAQDPWGTMISAGMTPDQVVEYLTNKPSPENVQLTQLQQELRALKEQQEKLLNRSQEENVQATEQAKNLLRKELEIISEKSDRFEVMKAMGSQEAAILLIEQTLRDEGYMMSVEEAAQAVEDYLTEEVLGLQKLKKIQAKINPPQVIEEQKPQIPQKPHTTTLSTRLSQSSPTKNFTAAQRRARAIAIASGQQVD